jgi:hypothetical protein
VKWTSDPFFFWKLVQGPKDLEVDVDATHSQSRININACAAVHYGKCTGEVLGIHYCLLSLVNK